MLQKHQYQKPAGLQLVEVIRNKQLAATPACVGHFNMQVYGDSLTFGASLKWPQEELQFLGTGLISQDDASRLEPTTL